MPRPKEFDPDIALGRAMELFHTKGYEATSMQDLLSQMDIGRGSMYDTFGGKRELFLAAMNRYADERLVGLRQCLVKSEDPLAAIRKLFLSFSEPQEGPCRGCLMVNTTVEMAPLDSELEELLRKRWQNIEKMFAGALERARERGDLAKSKDPRKLARFLVNTMQGVAVRSRGGSKPTEISDVVETALTVLD